MCADDLLPLQGLRGRGIMFIPDQAMELVSACEKLRWDGPMSGPLLECQ